MADGDAESAGGTPRLVAAATFATSFLPVLFDYLSGGKWRHLHYLAGDAYYYLLIARNAWRHGAITYDGETPTNGFHPLWQLTEIAAFPLAWAFGDGYLEAALLGAFFATLLLASVALAVVAWVASRHCPRAAFLLPALPAGVYTAMAYRDAGSQATLWMQANGMESALGMALFAVLLVLLCRGPFRLGATAMGTTLGLLVLSRLDLIFVPLALGIVALPGAMRSRAEFRSLAITTAVTAAIVGAYLLVNVGYAGSALPVSGAAKTTFPDLNLGTLGRAINYFAQPEILRADYRKRTAQLVIPLLFALAWLIVYLAIQWRGRDARATMWGRALVVCHLSVVLRHGYDLCFVHVIHTDYWYYPISQVIVFLGALWLVERALGRWAPGFRPATAPAVLGVCALEAVVFMLTIWREPTNYPYAASLWESRESIVAHFGDAPPRMLEMEDGILGYTLGFPALSATGLSLDREGAEARSRGQLLDYAWQRGFRTLAITPRYLDFARVADGMSAEQATTLLRGRFDWMRREREYGFALEYLSQDGSVAFFAITQDELPAKRQKKEVTTENREK